MRLFAVARMWLSLDVDKKTASITYDSQFLGIQLRIGAGRSDH